MAKSSRHKRGAILCLILLSTLLGAARLEVKTDPQKQATGYYLIPRLNHRELPADRGRRRSKITANVHWYHTLDHRPILVPGVYFIYPQCASELRLRPTEIGADRGQFQLDCSQ